VSDCAALVYKANYRPHQRREAGVWVDGERA
jgi:arginyl-tRNA--protein-N-Asp/Glu arginylyltransferase